jgi:hypothetical protein
MKDPFGSFLQEANSELYGTKISAIEFEERVGNFLKIEWAFRGEELIVHIYKAEGVKWPLTYAKLLYALMDKHASGEKREVGYEDMVDSWYIKSPGYGSGKLNAKMAAKGLCKKILSDLESLTN